MGRQTTLAYDDELWIHSKDANPTALAIFHEHYSYRPYADGRKPLHFVGPGWKMVLLTPNADALFVWRKFISGDNQEGVNCAVFRNTSLHRSPDLIRGAARLAWERWPGERLYTYVNPKKLSVRKWHGTKRLYCPYPPGRCFIEAGWQRCGITKCKKLVILELFPE